MCPSYRITLLEIILAALHQVSEVPGIQLTPKTSSLDFRESVDREGGVGYLFFKGYQSDYTNPSVVITLSANNQRGVPHYCALMRCFFWLHLQDPVSQQEENKCASSELQSGDSPAGITYKKYFLCVSERIIRSINIKLNLWQIRLKVIKYHRFLRALTRITFKCTVK